MGEDLTAYPKAELDKMWKLFLIDQFHDVLPGTSIGLVYEDTRANFKYIRETSAKLREEALEKLIPLLFENDVRNEAGHA